MAHNRASFEPEPRRIAVRGVNWLGDAVMTTPALLRVRERFPRAHITLFTPEKLRDLWINHPALDDTVGFNASDGPMTVSRRMRAGNFDLAIVLPNSPRAALEPWLARIPRRIGYARPWRTFFLTHPVPPRYEWVPMRKRSRREISRLISSSVVPSTVPPDPNAHHVFEYLHLVEALTADPGPARPAINVHENEVDRALQRFGISAAEVHMGLNPGAEYGPAKRWPSDRFAAAAIEIQRRTNCVWLLFGGAGDKAPADEIERAMIGHGKVVNLAGRTSIRELAALLKICRVLLTNDTGPMHLAAAVGTPVVATFGSTRPDLTGPGLPGDARHRLLSANVPCAPCYLRECPIDFRCMRQITVELVVDAVLAGVDRR